MLALFINPALSLILIGLINEFRLVSPRIAILWAFAFTTQLVLREYGVEFAPGSTDDLPNYIHIYKLVQQTSFTNLFTAEFVVGELEPVFITVWKISSLFISNPVILFFAFVFVCNISIIMLCKSLSRKFIWNLMLISFVAFPTTLTYEFLHLYRSSLCALFLTIAINKRTKNRLSWIVVAIFSHISALLFAIVYVFNRVVATVSKSNFKYLAAAIAMIALIAIFGSDLIVNKIYRYFYDQDVIDRSMRIVKTLMLIAYLIVIYRRYSKSIVEKSMIQTLLVIGFFGLVPQFNAVVDRLWILYLPIFIITIIPIYNVKYRAISYVISLPGLFYLLSSESITRFYFGIMDHPFNIPIFDFVYYILYYS